MQGNLRQPRRWLTRTGGVGSGVKARRYAAWLDQPLPALNHRTPRECVRTAAGRAEVDLLLKDMEHMEQRARGVPFDFSTIRRELGIAMH